MKKSVWIRLAWVAPLFLLLSNFVMSRFSTVLPKIMSDELTYSLNALERPLAEATLPNYLYYWIYSPVAMCGNDFYLCTKWLNLVWLLGLVGMVYLTSRLFAKPLISLGVAVLTMVGPISTYVSYFTPDIMFFFAISVLVYVMLRFSQDSTWWHWAALGAGLGLAALIKPHALFVFPTVLVYATWLVWRQNRAKWWLGTAKGAVAVATAMALKLLVGFAIAGPRGLGLFGGNYDGALGKVVRGGQGGGGQGGGLGGGQGGMTPLPEQEPFSLLNPAWLGTLGLQLFMHISVLIIFMGVPLWLLITESRRVLQPPSESKKDELALKFVVLVGVLVLTMMLVSSLYAAISQAWGETLFNRVMLRYYEFAMVFLPIGILLPSRSAWKSKRANWLIPLVSLVIGVVGTALLISFVPPIYTDSALLASVRDSGLLYWALLPISVGLIGYWLQHRQEAAQFWFLGFWPLVVIVYLLTSYGNLVVPGSTIGLYTSSTYWVRDNLEPNQIENMVVVGNDMRLLQTSQFWLRDPSVRSRVVQPEAQLNLNEMRRDTYFLFIGSLTANGEAEVVHKSTDFMVLKTPAKEVTD